MTTKRMKSNEVRVNWRDVLEHVRMGGSVIVEHYNRPIAQITPYTPETPVTYTALIGTSDTVVRADHCDVQVTREVGIGTADLWTDLPVRTDDDDKLAKVEAAADEVLTTAGWERVSAWEIETDGYRADVQRA